MKQFETLYKRSKTSKIQEWSIFAGERQEAGIIRVNQGQLGGKKQLHEDVITSGKNIGKSNETSPYEQACLEAESKWNEKKDSGYKSLKDLGIDITVIDDMENIESKNSIIEVALENALPKFNTDANGQKKCMLAKDWNKVKKIDYPVWLQPKFNGVRCLCFRNNEGKIVFLSREGKEYTSLPHLSDELKKVFEEYQDIILDGEIYKHNTPLQSIASWVKAFQLESSLLEYHIYDLAIEGEFEYRKLLLDTIFLENEFIKIKQVDTCQAHNKEIVKDLHNTCVKNGYEGAMLRIPKSTYGFGQRSSNLLKVKEFQEDEFKIISGTCGRGKYANCAIFNCITKEGKEFDVLAPGTIKEKETYYDNIKECIGKMLTVKYFDITPDGSPFHPIGMAIRDYESK